MNKTIASRLIFTVTVGVLCYVGRNLFLTSDNPLKNTNIEASSVDKTSDVVYNELNMDLSSIDPVSAFAEPALQEELRSEQVETLQNSLIEPLEALSSNNEAVTAQVEDLIIEKPEKALIQEKKVEEVKAAIIEPQMPTKREKELVAQEKFEKFSKHMEELQKQAQEELRNMSPEECVEAEQQVEAFQHNFQNEIERLSQMSPEEVEREKHIAMTKLERENPEAYQTIKSMEDMFMGLADASDY